ncbi:hypothetical protein AVEN_95016-1 [Araneus ventricosus]|uniref:Uncharacterized protein n=1 Tax=Araneus ventricosus TaxID=182803 RepID=A0A4Y2UA90_ARAVE|nr:hypothetical protein AVEN_8513-1 [Araneus ventricosus]GBO09433.1 hypothetical protein AVEN_95016-1 [Araneus ventricosus]
MQDNGESLMGQDRVCRPGDPISPIPGDKCVLLCHLLSGVLYYRPRANPSRLFAILAFLLSELGPSAPIFSFFFHCSQHYRNVTSEAMKRCSGL